MTRVVAEVTAVDPAATAVASRGSRVTSETTEFVSGTTQRSISGRRVLAEDRAVGPEGTGVIADVNSVDRPVTGLGVHP